MSLLNVPAGKELPEDIYVVIEIPANADPIKYEVDKESGALFVDRFMSTRCSIRATTLHQPYPVLDGDQILRPTPYLLQPAPSFRCRPVSTENDPTNPVKMRNPLPYRTPN